MSHSYTYSGNIYDAAAAGTTTFALTSTAGNPIGYLQRAHIHVYLSDDEGKTWAEQARPSSWDFDAEGTSVVLTEGIADGQYVKLLRITPVDNRFVDFANGSLLTAAQLDQAEDYSRYCDQELIDEVTAIDGNVDGSAVKQIFGTLPVEIDDTDPQRPVINLSQITQAEAEADPQNPTWSTDEKVATPGAIDRLYRQLVGDGAGFPGSGNKGKLGQLRIDTSGAVPELYYWDANAASPAWVEIKSKGEPGPPGPGATIEIGDTTTGDPGDPADVVNTGTETNAVLEFTIPRGDKGDKGDKGDDGPPGPTGDGVTYLGPIDPTTAPEPQNPNNGDFYVSTAAGASSWSGVGTVSVNTRLVYNDTTNQWDKYEPVTTSGVTKLVAGDNVTLTPSDGMGQVTIDAAGGVDSLWEEKDDTYVTPVDSSLVVAPSIQSQPWNVEGAVTFDQINDGATSFRIHSTGETELRGPLVVGNQRTDKANIKRSGKIELKAADSNPDTGEGNAWQVFYQQTIGGSAYDTSSRLDYNGNLTLRGNISCGEPTLDVPGSALSVNGLASFKGTVDGVEAEIDNGTVRTTIKDGNTQPLFTGIKGTSPVFNVGHDGSAYFASQIGIGLDNPQSKLHVMNDEADVSITLQAYRSNASGLSQAILLKEVPPASGATTGDAPLSIIASNGTLNSDIRFHTRQISQTDSERMRISALGNVGINTDDPQAKLDVNGTIRATSFDLSALNPLPA